MIRVYALFVVIIVGLTITHVRKSYDFREAENYRNQREAIDDALSDIPDDDDDVLDRLRRHAGD